MAAFLVALPGIVKGVLAFAGGVGVAGTAHQTLPGREDRERSVGRLFQGRSVPRDEALSMDGAREGADEEDEQADGAAASETNAGSCIGECRHRRDPCAGLRRQLEEHRKKLADYKANPHASDNKGLLGTGRDQVIIAARIRSLEGQIDNFERQLKACEERNGGQ